MANNFWERKRQQLQPQQPVVPSNDPWWAKGTNLVPTKTVPQTSPYSYPAAPEDDLNRIDGHDVSKAEILHGNAEECPRCPRNPRTGIRGNMYRPTKAAAMRCFDCGYIEGRDLGFGQTIAAVVEGKSHSARQTVSGGATGSNFHGNIRTAEQAVGIIR